MIVPSSVPPVPGASLGNSYCVTSEATLPPSTADCRGLKSAGGGGLSVCKVHIIASGLRSLLPCEDSHLCSLPPPSCPCFLRPCSTYLVPTHPPEQLQPQKSGVQAIISVMPVSIISSDLGTTLSAAKIELEVKGQVWKGVPSCTECCGVACRGPGHAVRTSRHCGRSVGYGASFGHFHCHFVARTTMLPLFRDFRGTLGMPECSLPGLT